MILKLLLKIWPALTPIAIYFFFTIFKFFLIRLLKKKSYIEADYQDINQSSKANNKPSPYSLKNKQFVFVVYLSLILLIISFLSFAIN